MTVYDCFTLGSLLGGLALVLLVSLKGRSRPLWMPISLFMTDIALMQGATLLTHLTHHSAWRVLDLVCTALAPAFAVHAVAVFVGMSVRDAAVVRLSYAASVALALVTAAALPHPQLLPRIDVPLWSIAFLAIWAAQVLFMALRLRAHMRIHSDAEEQTRIRMLQTAFVIGATAVTTEFWSDFGGPVLHLGAPGLLLMSMLLVATVLRHRLLDVGEARANSAFRTVTVLAGALMIAAITLWTTERTWVAAACAVALMMGVVLAVRESTATVALHEEGRRRISLLGSYAEQMAHDLRNPLAAILGAADELRCSAQLTDADRELAQLMKVQAQRMNTMIHEYQRLGSMHVMTRIVSVAELIDNAVAAQRMALPANVRLLTVLEGDVAPARVDPDLIVRALENLIRNAVEAMPDGGDVLVGFKRASSHSMEIFVKDSGSGIGKSEQAQVFSEFYTTKVHGRGVGLSFVRRVARAHGGDATLRSKLGVGTTVTLLLPMQYIAQNT